MTLLSLTFARSICCSRLRQSADSYCQSIFRSATCTPIRKKVVSLMYRRVIYTHALGRARARARTHTHTHTRYPKKQERTVTPHCGSQQNIACEPVLMIFAREVQVQSIWLKQTRCKKKKPKLIATITQLIDHFLIFNPDVFHSK